MSVSTQTQWFSLESPEAWIPQCTPSHSLFNLQDISQEDYIPNIEDFWFKLPSNSSDSSLNWNDFLPHNSQSSPSTTSSSSADSSYLNTSIWDPPFPSPVSSRKTQSSSPQEIDDLNPLQTEGGSYSPYSAQRLPRNIEIEVELSRQNLYKTELCRSWVETYICKYGNKCQFAHGLHELRPVIRHPKYKTEICKTFHTNGTCPYGKRCRFVHNPAELRMPIPSASTSNNSSPKTSSESLELLPPGISQNPNAEDNFEDEFQQLQERFKLANIATESVFYPSQTYIPLPPETHDDVDETAATIVSSGSNLKMKGSGLPFFQKLRKQKLF